MATYKKKVKRGNGGAICRYVGYNQKGVTEKFYVGYDPKEADRRIELIQALWLEMEKKVDYAPKPYWEPEYLQAAKAIARGEPPTLPKNGCYEMDDSYLRRLILINAETGTQFQPANPNDLKSAVSDMQADLRHARTMLSLTLNVPTATGQTLAEALDAYEAHTREKKTDPNGSLAPWGKTKLDQIKSIRAYLSDKRFVKRNFLALDLGELTDLETCDQMYDVFRRRPKTLQSGLKKRMAPASSRHLTKELGQFFSWLHRAKEFDWREPQDFNSIAKTPEKLTSPEKYQKEEDKKRSVIPTDHLRTLFEYALPIERATLLLGLNCAFGAAEIGQLRTGFVQLDSAIIDGVRFKTGNTTKHWLWPQTVAGLRWALERRRRQETLEPDYRDIIFMTERGKPLWHHTEKGNASNGIASIWSRLIQRVQKDNPQFPHYSFNKLRKTSATRILEIADAATASMILAHNTISDDRLLECYVQIPWPKLFKAQEQFAAELGDLLDTGTPNPWEPPQRTYIGLNKVKKIIELDGQNVVAQEIAKQVGVNVGTVYRQLRLKHGKRPGRRPKPKGAAVPTPATLQQSEVTKAG